MKTVSRIVERCVAGPPRETKRKREREREGEEKIEARLTIEHPIEAYNYPSSLFLVFDR